MRRLLVLFTFLYSIFTFSQISLRVFDENGVAVANAKVTYDGKSFLTDDKGFVKIPLAAQETKLLVEKENFTFFSKNIKTSPKTQSIQVLFVKSNKETEIQEVVFQKRGRPKITDISSVEVSPRQAQQITSLSGGVEGILKTLPSVNSNTELSSQYMVRGGNYDENLIYINDIEIYRPFLIRNSLQEGLSIINPDMVQLINFSPGGFEAKYGDKMSSSLNIYYRQPTRKFELSGEASLIGGRLTTGFATKDKNNNTKLIALFSGRYRNTNLVLNTMKEDTDFNPQYWDFQSYINYNITPKWDVSFIGFYSKNIYQMVPKQKDVDFGTLQNPIRMHIAYDGQENDSYKNMMGTLSLHFKPTKKWQLTLDNFAYQNREREYYTIGSGYTLMTTDVQTGASTSTYDAGGQIEHARNDLLVKTMGAQFKARFSPDVNTDVEAGVKYEKETLKDLTNEWVLTDSLGYNIPRNYVLPGTLDNSPLKLKYNIAGQNDISPTRLSAYAQFSKKLYWGESRVFINAGLRGQHWTFNNETLISPRVQFAIKPNWEADMLFKLCAGVYYQAPFYKEIKDLTGSFNPNIKAERSYQFILSNDYEFRIDDRPFKLSTAAYYKLMDRLIPYYLDNVRIRYSGENNAKGHAYGIDARIFGEFVPGVDSWISASYARAFQNIDDKGNIPLPTDQRFRFSMFFQDYMPQFPSMRVNLTLVYASGLPSGTPVTIDPTTNLPDFDAQYHYQKRLPSYKRVDIGLSKVFIDQKDFKASGNFWKNFRELTLGVQVFNAFNIRNTIANQWITDVSSPERNVYPVPVRLTGRFFNVTLSFKL